MTNNILKFKNKPYWKDLDRVGERSAIIISDAENFPKFFINQDVDEDYIKKIRNEKYPELGDIKFFDVILGNDHYGKTSDKYVSCIKNDYYTGYEVPLEFNDVDHSVLGRVIDKPTNISLKDSKVLTHIFIFWGLKTHSELIELINQGYELKKTKVCSIDIYSEKIGIGLDGGHYAQPYLASAECICNCYLGNGTYDIFQIEFEDKMNPESYYRFENFGTLVELDSKENFTIEDASEILSKLLNSPYGL